MTDKKVPDWVHIPPSVTLQVRVPQRTMATLREMAEADGLTVSMYVRRIIEQHIQEVMK